MICYDISHSREFYFCTHVVVYCLGMIILYFVSRLLVPVRLLISVSFKFIFKIGLIRRSKRVNDVN